MILKIEVHIRDDVYPTGGQDRLRRTIQHSIIHVVSEDINGVGAELKKIEFVRGKS